MAQLVTPFNARDFDPSQSAGQLPIGRHPVIVESSEVKANAKNDGGYLELGLKIIDGPQTGTTGAYRLNLYHSNPKTVEIANRQLSAVCYATGVFSVSDSAQLHNIPFVVDVVFQKGHEPNSSPEAKGYTEVKRVFDKAGNEPGRQPQSAQPQQQAPAPVQAPAPQPQQSAPWGSGAQQQQSPPAWGQQPVAAEPAQAAPPAAPWGAQPQALAPTPQPQQQTAPWGAQAGAGAGAPPWARR
jgi:hypothetical protein